MEAELESVNGWELTEFGVVSRFFGFLVQTKRAVVELQLGGDQACNKQL